MHIDVVWDAHMTTKIAKNCTHFLGVNETSEIWIIEICFPQQADQIIAPSHVHCESAVNPEKPGTIKFDHDPPQNGAFHQGRLKRVASHL